MKFLCVPCDAPMKLLETRPPDRGSISLVYGCPACGYEFAMMTNPYETQVVASMGVRVEPERAEATAAEPGGSRCPFAAAVRGTTGAAVQADDGVPWTTDAQERLATIPDFVRPMAKSGIEKFARERGFERVDGHVLDEAKDYFGM